MSETAKIEHTSVLDAIEDYFERGWTDGLPVVPPTPEAVAQFVARAGRDPDDVLIAINETNMQCTVEKAAINAVMAGCKPEYFPIIVAAVEAWAGPGWGPTPFYLGNATTGGPGQMLIINGPQRLELGMNCGINIFGPGTRANATIGRAVRLILINALGMLPGAFDMAIQGHPGKYSYCVPEDEENSPWEPLHVERGLPPGSNAVTVLGARGPVMVDERSHQDPEGILAPIARMLVALHDNSYASGPSVLVMGIEHARFIAKAGWSKQQVKQHLFEQARAKAHPDLRGRGTADADGLSSIVRSPDDFIIVVAGGSNGGMTSICPIFVSPLGVTVPVA